MVLQTDEARRSFETHHLVLDAVAHGMSLQRYRSLLLELYHVVWHFNPICAAAASRIGDEHRAVRYHLYDHMQQEKGHEEWMLNDLVAIGTPPQATRSHRPSTYTLGLCGYNYWSADRRHPCSVLGMLYALEVIASVYGGPFASAIRESLLLQGDQGVSFISLHSTMDAEHMAQLRRVLNTIGEPAAQDAIVESVNVNFAHFTRIVEAA
ncbi:MAG TPA: iron-containing redox enzyme family protein [Burkholderiaceae bacterium]|nr:iron-containing redox enzyme family protein [Burkholderiaceae bacterium]